MREKQYIPFGEEWKKEMNKWNKKDLIEFLRKTLMRAKSLEDQRKLGSKSVGFM